MPVIYLDILLAINLLIDYLLLACTAYLLHLPVKRWRLVTGAAIGAAGACVVFLPPLSLPVSLLVKLGIAALMVLAAYPMAGAARFVKHLAVFFGVSALFAGMAFALWISVSPQGLAVINGVVYYDVPPLLLVAFSVISYCALRLYDRVARKKAPRQGIFRLQIDGGAGLTECDALYDSGLHLTEGFSGSPVIVVRYDVLEGCLPTNLRQSLQALMRGREDDLSAHAALRSRLRLIPYHAIDGGGCLPAFQPVRVTLIDGDRRVDVSGAFVAVSRRLQSREYQALIGADLVDLMKGDGQSEKQMAIR